MIALAVSAITFLVFTTLLLTGHIGEASYCFLAAATALLGLVLHGFGRLEELDLRNLRLVLRELQDTKKELYVREEQLKKIALPLAEIIALTGSSEGRMNSESTWKAKRVWYKAKVAALANALDLSAEARRQADRYTQMYDKIDLALAELKGFKFGDPGYEETQAKLHQLNAELEQILRSSATEP